MKDFPIYDISDRPMGLFLALEQQLIALKHEIDKPNRDPRRIEDKLEVIHSGLSLLYMVRREYQRNYTSSIREPILSFAIGMERVMKYHDDSKSDTWKEVELKELISKLDTEISEWNQSLLKHNGVGNKDELIDIANFCMMIWYRMKQEVKKV